jgi:branched-chain amino acid transport system substrate-binding protein
MLIQNDSGFASASTGMFSLVAAQLAAKELPGVTIEVVHADHRLSLLG